MPRQILIVLLGVVLTYLVTVAGGYFVYHIELSTGRPEPKLGALVRYVVSPVIAVIVGSVVGVLAKRQAGVLAALSLMPWALAPVFSRRLNALHETILVLLSLSYVLVGAVVAQLVFRLHTRTNVT
jgi:hypothetical protein